MINSIDFWSRRKAENFKFCSNHIVISITDPEQLPPTLSNPLDTLRIEYYDVKDDIESLKEAYGMFKPEHANSIITFLDQYKDTPEAIDLVVHCEAGICRSSTIALFSHYYTKGPFQALSKATYINDYVIGMLADMSKVDAVIPKRQSINQSVSH